MIPANAAGTWTGMARDPQYGATMLFGLGGIFTEIYRDVQLCLLPAAPGEFERMIAGIKGYPILAGARGRAPKDIAALVDVMRKLAKIAEDFPGFDQIDLNPVIVYEKGVSVVDYRILHK